MDLINFKDEKSIVLDLETHDPTLKTLGSGVRRDGYIVGVGIKVGDWKRYLPIAHTREMQRHPDNLDKNKIFEWLQYNFKHYEGEIIGANLLYDLDFLAHKDVHCRHAKIIDVQIAEPLLDDNRFSYSLNNIAFSRFGERKVTTNLVDKYGKDFIERFRELEPSDAEEYVFGDLDLPERIWQQQKRELEENNLFELFELERRLVPLLLYMKRKGVRVDLNRAEEVGEIFKKRRDEHFKELKRVGGVGDDFNPNSPVQKADLLTRLGVPFPRREPTEKMLEKDPDHIGNPKLDKKTLAALPIQHPVIDHLIAWKEYDHAYSTFIVNYIFGHQINGRLHCSFNQLKGDDGGTVSGRFSSSDPNLQNIPSPQEDGDRGSLLRSIFIPEEGKVWWTRDWSQIEYRLLVHYAELTRCKGGDLAAEMYRNDPETDFHKMVQEMTNLPRKSTKTINFGICYGMGVPKLATALKIPRHEAEEFLETYHTKVPFVKELFTKAARTAEKTGTIYTLLRRKRRWDKWGERYSRGQRAAPLSYEEAVKKWGKNKISRAFTHKGLNALLQGGAADLMKIAMVQLWEAGLAEACEVSLTVHDELNGSISPDEAGRKVLKELTHVMEHCYKLNIPIIASGNEGNNWYEAK